MNWNEIITKIRTPETLEEGIADLNEYKTMRDTEIEKLNESNNKYKETNANLAMKISEPAALDEPEKTPEEIEGERLDAELAKTIEEMKA